MHISDKNDIQESLEGDHDAYARLVRRYQSYITAIMWRFTRDKAQCEVLVQDVFVQAWLSLGSYDGRGSLANWLTTIATRTGYRFWKDQARRRQEVNIYNQPELIDTENADEIAPERAADILHRLFRRLSPPERLVMTLMYFQNYTTKEIAKRVGWSNAAVKMRASRARKKLRKIAVRENVREEY